MTAIADGVAEAMRRINHPELAERHYDHNYLHALNFARTKTDNPIVAEHFAERFAIRSVQAGFHRRASGAVVNAWYDDLGQK